MISMLFYSSIVSLVVHHVTFFYFKAFPNKLIIYGCLATSIWNHGTTIRLAQITDRMLVAGCVGHNLLWLHRIDDHENVYWYGTLFFTGTGVMCYFCSKLTQTYRLPFHFTSHVLGTLSNVCLSVLFQKKINYQKICS